MCVCLCMCASAAKPRRMEKPEILKLPGGNATLSFLGVALEYILDTYMNHIQRSPLNTA